MNYNNIIDKIKSYNKIVVTGPQRSGTTFSAFTFASTLGYTLFDEVEHRNNPINIDAICENNAHLIMQAPAQCHRVEDIIGIDLVIFMVRDLDDIIASEKRISWEWHKVELQHYLDKFNLSSEYYKDNHIAEVKMAVFTDYQRHKLECDYMFVNYSDMQDSPLYINKEKRKHFSAKQVK